MDFMSLVQQVMSLLGDSEDEQARYGKNSAFAQQRAASTSANMLSVLQRWRSTRGLKQASFQGGGLGEGGE